MSSLHRNALLPDEDMCLRCGATVELPADYCASCDTRPQGGDAQQAPFTSGAVLSDSEADAQGTQP